LSAPSIVFGLPAYNGERHLAEALESLLGQTRDDFAIVVADDCSSDRTPEIVQQYAAIDSRVVYERNETRQGLVGNWNRVASLARERFSGARYFAWASDHDVWHPSWLEALAGELDAHPEAVLAYPLAVRMTETGVEMPSRDDTFETAGVTDPLERFRRSIRQTTWGYRVYGLARSDALERCGPFPLALLPDRLHLTKLALEGEFRQVRRRLWYRRYAAAESMSLRRQRRAFFPRGAPASARLPWWLVHAFALPETRLRSLYLVEAVRCELAASRRRLRRRRRTSIRSLRAAVKTRLLPHTVALTRAPASPDDQRAALDALGRTDLSVSSLVHYECLLALARAELLPNGDEVVLHFGLGLAQELKTLFPETRHVIVDASDRLAAIADRLHTAFPGCDGDFTFVPLDQQASFRQHVDLAVAVRLDDSPAPVEWPPAPTVYSFGNVTPPTRSYWLRELWVLPRAPRPDPAAPVPVGVTPGGAHVVGRRRILLGVEGDTVAAVARSDA
jgi:glycosyltransferase involved in cell wall biosynthesis